MQLTVTPENMLEWLALKTNQVPVPLLHVQMYFVMAKAVMEATEANVFGVISEQPKTAQEIATSCGLHPEATKQLLTLLLSMGYLSFSDNRFGLTKMAQKWIAPQSPDSVQDIAIYNNRVVWDWVGNLGQYLRTGEGVQYHDFFSAEQWQLYQKAMFSVAGSEIKEWVRRVPISKKATHFLDIGGANGRHAAALCQKYPHLYVTILDLPEAIEQAQAFAPKTAQIKYQKGNALTDDLGQNQYDVVFVSSVMHHFTAAQNQALTHKIAQSLKKSGIFIVNEFIRPHFDGKAELVGSSSDLFFGLTSTSGNWTTEEIQLWQTNAGLAPHKIINYLTLPGRAMVIAKK
jgi:ubiquinone/menaquinone biosynthesis C-methylase UbiE